MKTIVESNLDAEQKSMRLRWANGRGEPIQYDPSAYKRFRREHPQRVMLYTAKKNATRCEVPFALKDEDIVIPEYCPVLGIKIQRGVGMPCNASPSLDRIVPAKGYVSGNVRVISQRANTLKSNATLTEMRLILDDLERIHKNTSN